MLRRWGLNFGPYLVLEILLPGGTLLALLLFLYRRRSTVLFPAWTAPLPARRPVWSLDSTRCRIGVTSSDYGQNANEIGKQHEKDKRRDTFRYTSSEIAGIALARMPLDEAASR